MAGQWSRLSSFEKCLYLWAEINRYGLDLAAAEPTGPVSVIRYEDIFAGDPEPLKQLGRAAGVDGPVTIESAPFDRFQRPSRQRPVVASADLWERVTGLAERFGYPAEKLDRADIGDAVWRRYSWGGRGAKGLRKIRRIVEFSVLNLLGR